MQADVYWKANLITMRCSTTKETKTTTKNTGCLDTCIYLNKKHAEGKKETTHKEKNKKNEKTHKGIYSQVLLMYEGANCPPVELK